MITSKHIINVVLGISLSSPIFGQLIEKTHITTDKALYAPSDTVWFKAYVFDRSNKLSDQSISLRFLLANTDGKKMLDRSLPILNGFSEGFFVAPKEAGKYGIIAMSGQMSDSHIDQAFIKDFYVRSELVDEVRLSAFQRDIQAKEGLFAVDVYSFINHDKPEPNFKFKYELWSDEGIIDKGRGRTGESGEVRLAFKSVNEINNLKLHLISNDKDISTPVRFTLPIYLPSQKIALQFFPEGGELIDGVSNRIAFKAINSFGEGLDFKGVLLNEKKQVIDSIVSFHRGMGSFFLTPQTGHNYFVQLIEASDSLYALPKAKKEGIVLSLRSGNDKTKRLSLLASKEMVSKEVLIEFSQFDKIIVTKKINLQSRQFFNLPIDQVSPGLARVTLYNRSGDPLAERLTFVTANQDLKFEISLDKQDYGPREEVKGVIKVTDSQGIPLSANFSLAAIDQDWSKGPGDDQPNLMANILLTSELKGNIPTPNFYFTDHPKAQEALDLVMMTHGWRKFVPSRQFDPESISGTILRNNNKRKRIIDKPLSILSFKGHSLMEVSTDQNGAFYIPSTYLKHKGDSFLLTSSSDGRKDRFSILLNDTARIASIDFFKSISAKFSEINPNLGIDLFKTKFKLQEDRFSNYLLLNTVEVVANLSNQSNCELQEYHFQKPWKTKTAEEIDMTKENIYNWLNQVTSKIHNVGDNLQSTRFGSRIVLEDAINSTFKVGKFNFPFRVYLNCEPIPVITFPGSGLPPDFQIEKTFESIDFSNLESISVKEQYPGPDLYPIIHINTIDDQILYKPIFRKYRFYTTYREYSREFYSPSYDTPEKVKDPVPDLRTTIFWQATMLTDEMGKAEFSFYNADRPNNIQITVEGVDGYSRIGSQSVVYKVSEN